MLTCAQAEVPELWANGQFRLGVVLEERGRRLAGEAGTALLFEAIEAHRSALRVLTEAAHPVQWATTQNNLGAVLAAQGERLGGEHGVALLVEAARSFEAAVRVFDPEHMPYYHGTANAALARVREKLARDSA